MMTMQNTKINDIINTLKITNFEKLTELANQKKIYTKTELLTIFDKNSPIIQLAQDCEPPKKIIKYRKLYTSQRRTRLHHDIRSLIRGEYIYTYTTPNKIIIHYAFSKNAFEGMATTYILHFCGGNFKDGIIIHTLVIKEIPSYYTDYEIESTWIYKDNNQLDKTLVKSTNMYGTAKIQPTEYTKVFKQALEVIRKYNNTKEELNIISNFIKNKKEIEKEFINNISKLPNMTITKTTPNMEKLLSLVITMKNIEIFYDIIDDYDNPMYIMNTPQGYNNLLKDYKKLLQIQEEFIRELSHLDEQIQCRRKLTIMIDVGFSKTKVSIFPKVDEKIKAPSTNIPQLIQKTKTLITKNCQNN